MYVAKGTTLFGHAVVMHLERRLLYLNPKVLYLTEEDVSAPLKFGEMLEHEYNLIMPEVGQRDVRRVYFRPKHPMVTVMPFAGVCP